MDTHSSRLAPRAPRPALAGVVRPSRHHAQCPQHPVAVAPQAPRPLDACGRSSAARVHGAFRELPPPREPVPPRAPRCTLRRCRHAHFEEALPRPCAQHASQDALPNPHRAISREHAPRLLVSRPFRPPPQRAPPPQLRAPRRRHRDARPMLRRLARGLAPCGHHGGEEAQVNAASDERPRCPPPRRRLRAPLPPTHVKAPNGAPIAASGLAAGGVARSRLMRSRLAPRATGNERGRLPPLLVRHRAVPLPQSAVAGVEGREEEENTGTHSAVGSFGRCHIAPRVHHATHALHRATLPCARAPCRQCARAAAPGGKGVAAGGGLEYIIGQLAARNAAPRRDLSARQIAPCPKAERVGHVAAHHLAHAPREAQATAPKVDADPALNAPRCPLLRGAQVLHAAPGAYTPPHALCAARNGGEGACQHPAGPHSLTASAFRPRKHPPPRAHRTCTVVTACVRRSEAVVRCATERRRAKPPPSPVRCN